MTSLNAVTNARPPQLVTFERFYLLNSDPHLALYSFLLTRPAKTLTFEITFERFSFRNGAPHLAFIHFLIALLSKALTSENTFERFALSNGAHTLRVLTF